MLSTPCPGSSGAAAAPAGPVLPGLAAGRGEAPPLAWLALLPALLWASACDSGQSRPPSLHQGTPSWARVENPVRDRSRETRLILKAVNARPGMAIADIGAGAGYFSFKLAEAVGPTGHVYATDIDPAMIRRLSSERQRRGVKHLTVVSVDRERRHETGLGPASVDLILMANTFDYRSDTWASRLFGGIGRLRGSRYILKHLESCRRSLKPGGRLIIFQDKSGELGGAGGSGQGMASQRQIGAAALIALGRELFAVESELAYKESYDASRGQEPGYLIVFRKPRDSS